MQYSKQKLLIEKQKAKNINKIISADIAVTRIIKISQTCKKINSKNLSKELEGLRKHQ